MLITGAAGRLAFAERLICTRTAEGRSRAKGRGQHMGRPPKLSTAQQAEARARRAEGATLNELARSYDVSRSTFRGSRLDLWLHVGTSTSHDLASCATVCINPAEARRTMPSASENTSETDQTIAWQTEGLRVTAFGTIMPNSWKDITGSEPDQNVKQSPPMPSFEAGPYHGGRLVISQQVGRCDITLSPDPANSTPNQLLHLGDFQLALEEILQAVHKLYKTDATAIRLAMGAVILHPTESPADGLTLIKSILPISQNLPENAEDFFYQVNIPIVVNLKTLRRELKINRLLKWNTGVFQILNVAGGLGVPTQVLSSSLVSAVRLEMDVNTPAELSMPLSHDQIIEAIDTLAAQASAIGKVGGFPR